ncbi:MAG: hypothetical protein Fur0025_07570 [Oscillatoriaceae cyanobacterium]
MPVLGFSYWAKAQRQTLKQTLKQAPPIDWGGRGDKAIGPKPNDKPKAEEAKRNLLAQAAIP